MDEQCGVNGPDIAGDNVSYAHVWYAFSRPYTSYITN